MEVVFEKKLIFFYLENIKKRLHLTIWAPRVHFGTKNAQARIVKWTVKWTVNLTILLLV